MDTLEMATTSQLLDELGRRFRGVIFCGIQAESAPPVPGDPEAGDELRYYYRGGLTLAYGLTKRLKRLLDIEAAISECQLEDVGDEPEAEEEAG